MVLSTASLGRNCWTGQDGKAREDAIEPMRKHTLVNVAVSDERSLQHLPAGHELRLRARFTKRSRTGEV